MQLFIDTNIYLAFYQLTNEDLEELDKLAVLVGQGEVVLHVTDQVRDEFGRNREVKIADAIKRLSEQRLDLKFPHMCKDYPEYSQLRDYQKSFEEKHASLIKKIISDSECNDLKADKTICKLFANANSLKITPEIAKKAQYRVDIGNPPGKNGSLGDALNWETLLEKLPEAEALYLITEDRDYSSALSEGKFKEFLADEWNRVKNSNVIYYKRLSLFFKCSSFDLI